MRGGRRCLPRRLVSPEPCAKAEAPWRRRVKKIQSFRNIFWNFIPNFREQMANDKHYPKGKQNNENTYETNAARHIADSYETKPWQSRYRFAFDVVFCAFANGRAG
jgi:hypothetical protein